MASCPMRKSSTSGAFLRVSDGTRTRDRLDHNQELYRLSYAHRGVPPVGAGDAPNLAAPPSAAEALSGAG